MHFKEYQVFVITAQPTTTVSLSVFLLSFPSLSLLLRLSPGVHRLTEAYTALFRADNQLLLLLSVIYSPSTGSMPRFQRECTYVILAPLVNCRPYLFRHLKCILYTSTVMKFFAPLMSFGTGVKLRSTLCSRCLGDTREHAKIFCGLQRGFSVQERRVCLHTTGKAHWSL